MKVGGKILGFTVVIATILLVIFTLRYTQSLEEQRNATVQQLMSMPQYAECKYDQTTCPQAEQTIVMPDITGLLLAFLGIILGVYLIRSDSLQRGIVQQLEERKAGIAQEERKDIIMSILTKDEQTVVRSVMEQPGITQATLNLRTDFSKAKLSSLIKELEERNVLTRKQKGRTKTVHLKREL